MAGASRAPGLTDTDILIDGARNLPEGVAFISSQLSSGNLQISIVSAMELVVGCRDRSELGRLRQFLGTVRIVAISEAVSGRALQLLETFHLSHGILLPDAMIAATALEHSLKLYTRNVRHFDMVPGLGVEQPY